MSSLPPPSSPLPPEPPPGYGPPPGFGPPTGYGPPPGSGRPGYGQPPGYGPPGYPRPRGVPPQSIDGPFYNAGLSILLAIVTLGIWRVFWTYRTNEDLQRYNGDGLGGAVGAILAFFLTPVVMFTIPNEIEKMYQRDGRQSPVSTVWGLWFLLPIIGNFVWYLKVQQALNDFWMSKGARP